MNVKAVIIICFLFWIAIACENEVDILQKPYDSKLSIQCLITPGAFPKLYLNSTMPFLDPALTNRQMFVDNAEVEITSDHEVILMKPDSLFDMFYGIYTYFYKLEIQCSIFILIKETINVVG